MVFDDFFETFLAFDGRTGTDRADQFRDARVLADVFNDPTGRLATFLRAIGADVAAVQTVF